MEKDDKYIINVLKKKYNLKIIEIIGHGGFGNVYLGELHNNIKVAIKVIVIEKTNKIKIKLTTEECFLSKSFKALHIIHTNSIRQDEYKEKGLIIFSINMEYAIHGSLGIFLKYLYTKNLLKVTINTKSFNWINNSNQILIIFFINQLIDTFKLLFISNIVHLDIKLENILLCDEFLMKLCDFSLTRQLSKKQLKHVLTNSTWCYQAPDYYTETKTVSFKNIFKIDLFAFGLIVFFLLFKFHLFPKEHKEKMNYETCIKDIERGRLIIENYIEEKKINNELAIFALKLINKDIEKIPDIIELADDEFLNKNKNDINKIRSINQSMDKKLLFEIYKFEKKKNKRKKFTIFS